MRLILVMVLLLTSSGCGARYKLVRIERVGPVEVEIWKDRKLNRCERRVYLDSFYYHGVVQCQ